MQEHEMPINAPNQSWPILGPEALRCPELHDFSDLRDGAGRVNRPLIVALVLAAVLTIGHFVQPTQSPAPTPVAQQTTTQASG
jgi:hypothetical protein